MNTRIQFELSEDKIRELQKIMDLAGIRTRTDLFNNALAAFQWLIAEKRSGRMIASIDEGVGVYKELVMPVFSSLKLQSADVPKTSARHSDETSGSDEKEAAVAVTATQARTV